MKHLLLILLSFPLFLSAQESISYTSPLSEYISDTHQFEDIERTITIKDNTITIFSKGKEATDIQTWIIQERIKEGSDFLFNCISTDKKYPTSFKVYDYEKKVERIEVLQESKLIRFHID